MTTQVAVKPKNYDPCPLFNNKGGRRKCVKTSDMMGEFLSDVKSYQNPLYLLWRPHSGVRDALGFRGHPIYCGILRRNSVKLKKVPKPSHIPGFRTVKLSSPGSSVGSGAENSLRVLSFQAMRVRFEAIFFKIAT